MVIFYLVTTGWISTSAHVGQNFLNPIIQSIKPVAQVASSEVPRNPLTRWDVSSTPANGIFLTKNLKNKNKNAQRVEND